MPKEPSVPSPSADPRGQAEDKARADAAQGAMDLTILTPEGIRKLVHDLRVHQIELEMQNEELRRTQEALEASQARYFDLYNLAPVGYFSLSRKGLVLEANLTGAGLLGVARGELIQQPLSRFIAYDDQDSYYLHQRRLFETGEPQGYEVRMVRRDRGVFWVRMTAIVVRDDAEAAPVGRIVMSDIDAQKQAEEQRLALERRLRETQKRESLRTMAGGIAHHFNNQLAGVVGNLDLAKEELPPDSKAAGFVLEAEKSAWRATELGSAMLKYVGQGVRRQEPLDLAEIIRELLPIVRAALPDNARLALDLPAGAPSVTMDPADARQVVMNLANNAWEALGQDAGVVRLAVGTASGEAFLAQGRLVGDDPGAGPWLVLEVSDSGAGMDSQTINRMFDPFFSTKFTGRGLGLAITLGIVRACGGAFLVESAPQRGTVIRVLFPPGDPLPLCLANDPQRRVYGREMPALAPAPGKLSRSGANPSAKAVLVVDDEEQIRTLTQAMLHALGFEEVFTAASGTQALTIFGAQAESIGCAIVDIGMPGMDGWQTLQALRAIRPQLPVVLCTGYDIAHAQREESADQPDGWLLKPYTSDKLKTLLDALMPAKEATK